MTLADPKDELVRAWTAHDEHPTGVREVDEHEAALKTIASDLGIPVSRLIEVLVLGLRIGFDRLASIEAAYRWVRS